MFYFLFRSMLVSDDGWNLGLSIVTCSSAHSISHLAAIFSSLLNTGEENSNDYQPHDQTSWSTAWRNIFCGNWYGDG
jgi:hypothetical protein